MVLALFAIIVGSTLVASCQNMSSSEQQIDLRNLSTACNDFTISLYKHLATSSGNNIVTSPLSLHLLLSLLSNGAGGSTLNELQAALRHDDRVSLNDEFKALISSLNNLESVDLHMANAVYVQDGFQLIADFLSLCTNIFQSSISRVDFKDSVQAAKSVNSWVQERTNNKISDAISSDDIDEDTRLVLVNAIYFKSKWQHTFDEEHTTKREFHVSKTEINLVPTMFKKSKYTHGEIPAWNTKYIEIPYMNQDIVMIILLPDREIELQTLESNFNWNTLADAPKSAEQVELYLPKFKFEITIDLETVLRKIGLNSMFGDCANFTRLSEIPLKVSRVLQKVFVEVNEEGSEAAAATVATIRLRRAAFLPEIIKFVVDRPFMFAIEYKPSRMPLFLGSVRNIESSQERDEL
ncbi:antichymotrypsin-2 isoform X2 [Ooceraea biroi]|uniref:Neuroserpin n=1 Tax=Ooceraea biroi TaxID=2015173 RepID=A0A026WT44_OOCBI|nr:antichymotrypsin-2 isoform X2 [Ooceraea biroi]EZA59235.1 Neuroserpin [Ooceraea biroi]